MNMNREWVRSTLNGKSRSAMTSLTIVAIALLLLHPEPVSSGGAAGGTLSSASAHPGTAPAIMPSPAVTPTPDDVAGEQLFLPLVRHPFHAYLPLAAFENAAPQVSAPFPADDAERASLNAYLAWSHTEDPEGDDYWFEVYLDAGDGLPHSLIGETRERFLEPPFTFELNTRYAWQVVAVDERGGREPGPVWRFSTEDLPDPPPLGEMIPIPAGWFFMGCDPSNPVEDVCAYGVSHVELPLRQVYLDAFEIDKYEVTNSEYQACVEAGACNPPRRVGSVTREHYYDDPAFNDYPVLFISRWDAEDYCTWMDKRLPTEAEWEKAARGSVDTRKYPWGNEPQDCTRTAKTPDNRHCLENQDTRPVGSYPRGASPYGLMDVAGNAFEWVSDLYEVMYYSYAPNVNPQGPDFSRAVLTLPPEDEFPYPIFSIRGGSNMDNAWYMRAAHRHWGHHGDEPYGDAPLFRSHRVGFRCARDFPER